LRVEKRNPLTAKHAKVFAKVAKNLKIKNFHREHREFTESHKDKTVA
jgi:hypothetical protein